MIVGAKFKLKLIILICCTKFSHKFSFLPKTEKVNTTIEFHIFKSGYKHSQNEFSWETRVSQEKSALRKKFSFCFSRVFC